MKILVKNGRLIDPKNKLDAVHDIAIAGQRIVAIDPDEFDADRVIDASGLAVIPGLVDLSVRLREPGYEHRDTLENELMAALSGGVTRLVLPPDTDPTLDEPGLVEMLKHRARALNQTYVYPLGAMTEDLEGKQLTEMSELTRAGCVAFSHANRPLPELSILKQCMQYAQSFGYSLWLRPHERSLTGNGVAASGEVASRLGLSGVPVQSETIALHALFELQRSIGVRLHLCRISSAQGIELVRQAKAEGLPVTCDVSIHHVHLTDVDIGFFDSNYRLDPPLRGQRDRDAITQGLLDGTIDAICSDHIPLDDEDKLVPFAEAQPGASGVELLFSLVYKWAKENNISLLDALTKVTCEPVSILQKAAPAFSSCGQLSVGSPADLVLVDLEEYWTVDRESLLSQSVHTPFINYQVPGRVKLTIVSGRVMWEKEE